MVHCTVLQSFKMSHIFTTGHIFIMPERLQHSAENSSLQREVQPGFVNEIIVQVVLPKEYYASEPVFL